jgi:hypothetical protein
MKPFFWMRAAVGLGICLALSSCMPAGGLPTGPSTETLNGTWTGGATDRVQTGSLTLTLSESKVREMPTRITGSWSSTLSGATMLGGGTVSGTASSNSVDLTLHIGQETCGLGLLAVVDGRKMSGPLGNSFPRCSSPTGWEGAYNHMTLTRP